jgi:HAMP domain-containing protein
MLVRLRAIEAAVDAGVEVAVAVRVAACAVAAAGLNLRRLQPLQPLRCH